MMKYLIAISCLFPGYIFCQVQQKDTLRFYNPAKSIEYMNQYITLKFTQNSDIETLAVITNPNEIHLSPNAKSTSRLSFNYKFISCSVEFIPKFLAENYDDAIKGKTSGTGYGLNLNFNHWMQELSYTKTKGYYLENTSDYDVNWRPGDPYTQFPELVYQNFQGITAYNFNQNFSVNAISSQSERQLKSAGSFIPHLIYRYYIIDDRSTPVSGGSTQKSNNFELAVGAGYYYTFVVKNNFYFSLGLTPSGGIVFTNLTTRFPSGNVVTKQQNAIFRLDGRTGLGYNGERFFTGLYMKLSGSTYKQEKSSAINEDERVAFQAFLGYRLRAPGWLKENVKSISDKVPL